MEQKDIKNPETKDNKNLKILLIVVIALIIIVTIVVVGVSNLKKGEQTKTNEQKEVEQTTTGEQVSLIDMENKENAKIENGKKENNSQALLTEKDFNGFKIKEIKLYTNDGITYFKAEVINNSGKKLEAKPITVKFSNKDGEEYSVLNTYIGDIQTGETGNINASTTDDIANAYNFVINFN